MGPVNWLAVVLSALVAAAVLAAFDRVMIRNPARFGATVLLLLVGSAMLGHALARIGADKLALKPQLYFMQSGGLAGAFVIPALWIVGLRGGTRAAAIARDSLAFLVAYLAMGATFFLLA